MTDACNLPRVPLVGQVSPAPSLHGIIKSLDLDGCRVTYIVMSMNEFEKATGPGFEHWPPAIQLRMNKQLDDFRQQNPKAFVHAVTQGVHDRACVLALHWKETA